MAANNMNRSYNVRIPKFSFDNCYLQEAFTVFHELSLTKIKSEINKKPVYAYF